MFLSGCIFSLCTKLELIAIKKTEKVWFHSAFLVEFHGYSEGISDL